MSGPVDFIALIASFSELNTLASPVFLYTPSLSITSGSIAVDFITDPSGAIFPFGKVTVDVSPLRVALALFIITFSGSTPSFSNKYFLTYFLLSDSSHHSRFSLNVFPETVNSSKFNNPSLFRLSITSGTPPAA